MKFNSQICTSRSQSERLLALGLKKETADMVHQRSGRSPYNVWAMSAIEEDFFPAWSLHRLIVLSGMCIIESSTEDIYDKVIRYIEFLIKCGDFNKEYLEELC